jgi:pimeloyl-ACP methyl ester carboxylesterase
MTTNRLAYARTGAGASLVLLHGIGSSRRAWEPVIPALAEHFDVLAIDLPGFGESAALPAQVEPLPAALAASVALLLDDLGVIAPHIAGNSLGGWVALELAAICPVSSVALLSPAGLWRGATPRYCRVSLRASRWLAHHAGGPLSRLAKYRLGRMVVLGQTHGRPSRLTAEQARGAIQALGSCRGFDATLRATARRSYLPVRPLDTPVTVAFGDRDRLLLRCQSRHLDQLPPGTCIGSLPRCGHVPMADNSQAVTALITASTARAPRRVPRETPHAQVWVS